MPLGTEPEPPVFTVGHSTRPIGELIDLLREHGVAELVDVRRFSGSRRHPQFNEPNLREALEESGIQYSHDERLGGRRAPRAGSENTGWENAGFRGYADYLTTSSAREALAELNETASRKRVALMCAEAVPWRCHRNLIADWLTAQGRTVVHILSAGQSQPHTLNPMAVPQADGSLRYPGRQPGLFDNPPDR